MEAIQSLCSTLAKLGDKRAITHLQRILDFSDRSCVAAAADGSTLWVVDGNKNVYVYNASGSLLGSWTANGLTAPTGISVAVPAAGVSGLDVAVAQAGDHPAPGAAVSRQ